MGGRGVRRPPAVPGRTPWRSAAGATGLALALTSSLLGTLTGCSAAVDQAHAVQTRVRGVDGVLSADVSAPSPSRAARIDLTYADGLHPPDLVALVDHVTHAARAEKYPTFRLDLRSAANPDDVLVVDDSFAHSPDEATVAASWANVTDALIGRVTYTFEPGAESIAVDSGGGLGHDVTEAGRIGYGFADTTWTFTSGRDVFVADGRVSPTDVELLQQVQRTVGSTTLPLRAQQWRLEARTGHVLLVLDVGLPAGTDPDQLTPHRFGARLRPLAHAALDAARVGGQPVWLQLRHATDSGTDVFGWLVTGQHPVRGRDPRIRGWDQWLVGVAGGLAGAGRRR
ncbi:MAG: hypothetical protein ACXVEC_02705 [Nocardioides sp.]